MGGTTSTRARQRFLDALASGVTVSAAASAAGIGRQTAYDLRRADKQFADAWEGALEAGTHVLEDRGPPPSPRSLRHAADLLVEGPWPHVYRDNLRVASVGVMRHEYGRDETARPTVDHAAVLEVLYQAGVIAAPGPTLESPHLEP
jgi:hypothetical protein